MRSPLVIVGLASMLAAGCQPSPLTPPASQPASRPTESMPASAAAQPASREWESWTREQALAKLADDSSAAGAAVRILELAQVASPIVPQTTTDTHLRAVRVIRFSEQYFACGLQTDNERLLRAAVLIDATTGEVQKTDSSDAESMTLFYVSADAEVFPHLLVLTDRVRTWGSDAKDAVVFKPLTGLRFDLRTHNEYPYVALLYTQEGKTEEVARYKWDPYELSFMGPETDKLPEPSTQNFEIDLSASQALVPVGGDIEPPKPIDNEEMPRPPQPEPEPM
ncbi:MAG: hypothetical protein ACKVS9_08580 [Phycisphaerae bacterium]